MKRNVAPHENRFDFDYQAILARCQLISLFTDKLSGSLWDCPSVLRDCPKINKIWDCPRILRDCPCVPSGGLYCIT
jgi:hypothetical protein